MGNEASKHFRVVTSAVPTSLPPWSLVLPFDDPPRPFIPHKIEAVDKAGNHLEETRSRFLMGWEWLWLWLWHCFSIEPRQVS